VHGAFDGSGTIERATNARRLEAIGDTFEMDMDREPFGEIAMGKYEVLNTVTRIVPNALLESIVCDWSEVAEAHRDRFPIVSITMLEKSVDRPPALVTDQSRPLPHFTASRCA
jgi:hypothetical protein